MGNRRSNRQSKQQQQILHFKMLGWPFSSVSVDVGTDVLLMVRVLSQSISFYPIRFPQIDTALDFFILVGHARDSHIFKSNL